MPGCLKKGTTLCIAAVNCRCTAGAPYTGLHVAWIATKINRDSGCGGPRDRHHHARKCAAVDAGGEALCSAATRLGRARGASFRQQRPRREDTATPPKEIALPRVTVAAIREQKMDDPPDLTVAHERLSIAGTVLDRQGERLAAI